MINIILTALIVFLIAIIIFLTLKIRRIKGQNIRDIIKNPEKNNTICDKHSVNIVQEETKVTETIINGLNSDEFKLYIQFVVDSKTKKIVSGEGLSRWVSGDRGIINPGEYIPVMEESGLITDLDYYMFEKICSQLENWGKEGLGHLSLSCNITRITISEKDFVEKIKSISKKYAFDRSRLIIEITEDAIEKDRENAMENIVKSKELGFRVALDDLGNGYTSLLNLCEYPVDVVKIDREILLKTDTKRGIDLFCGIIALAHNLGLKAVCEGVETEEQNKLVIDSGCDYIQGWYYSKAMPLGECDNFIKEYKVV